MSYISYFVIQSTYLNEERNLPASHLELFFASPKCRSIQDVRSLVYLLEKHTTTSVQ